jgi:hypothetical protein
MRLEINIIAINYEDFVDNINAYICHFRAVTYKTRLTGLALLRENVILPHLYFQRTPRSSAEQHPCQRNCELRIRETESRFLLIKAKIKFNLRIYTEFQMYWGNVLQPYLAFGRSRTQVSSNTPAILTELYHGLPQFLQASIWTVPQNI